jgi:ribonuclease P/MRP protein subunit RPP1
MGNPTGPGTYETVHAHPDGESTVSRVALTASEYGFDGLVVRNHGDTPASYDPNRIREAYDIDIVTAVEIRAQDPQQASGFIGSHRDDNTIVIVHGGTSALNRFAVEQEAVDVLAHPMRGEGDFNHVLAREAIESGVRIEFNLSGVLRDAGGTRVQTLSDLQKLREIVQYYETPYVVSADPQSHLQLRAPRELQAVGDAIGFGTDEIAMGLREWGRLAERNRERQSDAFVQPGVRIVEDSQQKKPDEHDDTPESSE